MSNEPTGLDDDLMKRAVDEGGAVLVIMVLYKGQLYRCEQLVTGCELETATELVRLRLREMAGGVDFESAQDGPVAP